MPLPENAPADVIDRVCTGNRLHPTHKSAKMLQPLIDSFCKPISSRLLRAETVGAAGARALPVQVHGRRPRAMPRPPPPTSASSTGWRWHRRCRATSASSTWPAAAPNCLRTHWIRRPDQQQGAIQRPGTGTDRRLPLEGGGVSGEVLQRQGQRAVARAAAQSVRGRSGRSLSDAKGGPPRDHRGPAARQSRGRSTQGATTTAHRPFHDWSPVARELAQKSHLGH